MEISVLMPVYNSEKYIDEAMVSVLNQSFTDFELVIVDDGSSDNTVNKIKQYKDPRIRLMLNSHGYIDTLNKGLSLVGGKYVARMDSDDIMEPDRLLLQYQLMESKKDIVVCGSWLKTFGAENREIKLMNGEVEHPLIFLLLGNFIAHSTSIIRKSFLDKHDSRYEYYNYAEDYKLWSEIANKGGRFYILPEYLMRYRLSDDNISHLKQKEQSETGIHIKKEILGYLVNAMTIEKDNVKKLSDLILHFNILGLLSCQTSFELFFHLFQNIIKVEAKVT